MTIMIETSSWGQMEVEVDQIIQFNKGIPGFEEETKFAIISYDDSPFSIMQSIAEPSLSFLLVDPFLFEPKYEFELPEHDAEELEINGKVSVLCIVTIQETLIESTINLLAPIVINPVNCQGKQIVLHDTGYATRHKVSELSASEQLFAKEGE
ncbi:flagellar assembly protein FliW [Paenibacillus urinalis]|uniref:Flagellar assembly factor FliW n=1 Tax=Paenibacillus urinalis TaxID=521520 RepID=A0ABY7X829_9BACL|nr:flagellar assembly protein FliW [Paenibacillus urinalis]WDH98286.1 flagellar assembly protein FliW [Paenibacillus urinalis]WDI01972.1 flagellar assembly protein FliW [Paenibacillus urinalis]